MKSLSKWGGFVLFAIALFMAVPVEAVHAASSVIHSAPVLVVGATVGANVLTLSDWAKRMDPGGKVDKIAELLVVSNEILLDMTFVQGNLPTGTRTTVRTGLPTVYWRLLNMGTPPSKSTTAQVDEASAMLEAWSEVDEELVNLNGDPNAFRLSEAKPFIEAMNQEMASTLFYGNQSVSPEEFTGLSIRYSDKSALNAQNIVDAGGTGADNTSIWLILWGEETAHGIFPKGSKAGLEHKDLGLQVAETTAGIAGNRMMVYREQYKWKNGLALRNWRYVVRICNIDISELILDNTSSVRIRKLLAKAIYRIPNLGMGKPVFYANRTILEYLDIQGTAEVAAGGGLTFENVDGRRVVSYRGIPIRITDALLETEAKVV